MSTTLKTKSLVKTVYDANLARLEAVADEIPPIEKADVIDVQLWEANVAFCLANPDATPEQIYDAELQAEEAIRVRQGLHRTARGRYNGLGAVDQGRYELVKAIVDAHREDVEKAGTENEIDRLASPKEALEKAGIEPITAEQAASGVGVSGVSGASAARMEAAAGRKLAQEGKDLPSDASPAARQAYDEELNNLTQPEEGDRSKVESAENGTPGFSEPKPNTEDEQPPAPKEGEQLPEYETIEEQLKRKQGENLTGEPSEARIEHGGVTTEQPEDSRNDYSK